MMMREEESTKEVRREKEEEEKEKKTKSSVNDESHLKSNDNNDESRQNDGDGSIPESVLKEFEAFVKDNNDNSKNNNSITFSETQLSLPVRVLIHQMVKEKGKNMLGSRTISETNQIRAFRKKDYFSNKEGDEDKEEDKEEDQTASRARARKKNLPLLHARSEHHPAHGDEIEERLARDSAFYAAGKNDFIEHDGGGGGRGGGSLREDRERRRVGGYDDFDAEN